MKIWINPRASGEDQGNGGVGRIIRAQQEWYPRLGHEVVDDAKDADVLAFHIQADEKVMARHPEKPVVAHVHGLYWQEYDWEPWAHKANRGVLELIAAADIVTAPSEWVAHAIRRHTNRDTVVIPHGVDLDEWKPKSRPDDIPPFVFWDKTRVDAVCNPAPLAEVARLCPNVQFVSTMPMPGRELANVRVVGLQPYNMARDLMKAASIYLATSRETFGISTIQALAAGVPVVGFRWGGQREFMTEEAGILVLPDDNEGLAEAIRTVMAEHERYSAGAEKLGADIGGWGPYMDAYISTYERAIALSARQGPRTTVVVPAYGLADYLPATLDSVLAQSDDDWECLIVDDASPDACGAIADEYAERDPRFRVIHNATNQYLAAARNTGIAAARGRYILPLDADDLLPPNAVRTLADELDADRTTDIAYGRVFFVDDDGESPTNYGHRDGPGYSGWPMPFRFDWQAIDRNLLPYSSMFRREAWRLVGGYRTHSRTAEDADFWLRLSSYGFVPRMVTNATTLIYRNREGSMSRVEEGREWSSWFPWGTRYRRQPPAGSSLGENPNLTDSGDIPVVPSLSPSAVAVVIPVGPGHEAIVRDAIDSVEAQTFPLWRCIVVNDSGNSLGNLPQWVEVLETPEPGTGVATARNIGVDAAEGCRWFLPLDADDMLQPTALELLVMIGQEHPDEVLFPDCWEDQTTPGEFTVYENHDYEPRNLVRRGSAHAVTALTPRAIWEAVGGYPVGIPWEDWAFQLLTADAGYCSRRVAAPLFTYRKHTGRRRLENLGAKEESEDALRAYFNDRFWSGGQLPMACKKCGAGKATTVSAPVSRTSAKGQQAVDMKLMEFGGPASGSFKIKGPSGTQYRVQRGRGFYVRVDDVEFFLSRQGYRVAPTVAPAKDDAPPLVATGTAVTAPSEPPPPPPPPQCTKQTKAGTRCKNNATDGRFCAQHKPAPVTA